MARPRDERCAERAPLTWAGTAGSGLPLAALLSGKRTRFRCTADQARAVQSSRGASIWLPMCAVALRRSERASSVASPSLGGEAPFPAFIESCDPTLSERARAGKDWLYEIKAD